jgi:hypothetical protein
MVGASRSGSVPGTLADGGHYAVKPGKAIALPWVFDPPKFLKMGITNATTVRMELVTPEELQDVSEAPLPR